MKTSVANRRSTMRFWYDHDSRHSQVWNMHTKCGREWQQVDEEYKHIVAELLEA